VCSYLIRLFAVAVRVSQGLSIPSSDVDLVVCDVKEHYRAVLSGVKPTSPCIQTLAEQLQQAAWVQSMTVIASAAMPIIKLNARGDDGTTLRADISFDGPSHRYECLAVTRGCCFFCRARWLTVCCCCRFCWTTRLFCDSIRGLVTAALVMRLLRDFPALRPLTLVLKQLLVVKGLNDPFTGGLSSYGVALVVAAFLNALRTNPPHAYPG